MQPVQKISAPLKCMLLAFFLWGCTQNEKILPEKVGYLTADFDSDIAEETEFSGILVRDTELTELGKVRLAVKVESENGERIEFIILNYKKNSIYKIEEAGFIKQWDGSSEGDASGSLRYCASGRFFMNQEQHAAAKVRLPERGTF